MGFIRNLREIPVERKELSRWITVMQGDPALKLPALEFEVKFIDDNTLLEVGKPFRDKRKKKGDDIDLQQEKQFRSKFILAAVKNWKGVTNRNLRRASDYFLRNPEVFDGDDNEEWIFSDGSLGIIGEHISSDIFSEIVNEATDLNSFAEEILERERSGQS